MSYLNALYKLYPQIVRTSDEVAYDIDDNVVEYDEQVVIAEANSMETTKENIKASAIAKLTALGLTDDEISHLITNK